MDLEEEKERPSPMTPILQAKSTSLPGESVGAAKGKVETRLCILII